jgi:integrase
VNRIERRVRNMINPYSTAFATWWCHSSRYWRLPRMITRNRAATRPGVSRMLAQGTPLHVVSEVLGHASITITKDVYGHLVDGDKRAAAESMSRALSAGSQAVGSQTVTGRTANDSEGPVTWARSEGLEPPAF